MARSISALAKPMLSMLAIAASRSPPMVRAEGSLKRSADACTGAGEGVAGAFCVLDDGAGAVGAAGVWTRGGAGVEGAALLEDAAGAVFGLETMHTMKPFSSMLYDWTVLASCRILPVLGISDTGCGKKRGCSKLTGVDELLLGDFPAFVCLDL